MLFVQDKDKTLLYLGRTVLKCHINPAKNEKRNYRLFTEII